MRNEIVKSKGEEHENSEETLEVEQFDEDETIVVVKKRGNKVFIEI